MYLNCIGCVDSIEPPASSKSAKSIDRLDAATDAGKELMDKSQLKQKRSQRHPLTCLYFPCLKFGIPNEFHPLTRGNTYRRGAIHSARR